MSSIWEQITGTAEDAFNAGKEWAGDVVDDVKNAATNFAIDQAINNMKDQYSFENAFVSHDKLTPELIEQGWREGLDGQPYNYSLAEKFAPGGIFHDPDVDRNTAMAQAAQNAGITSSPVPTNSSFLSQDLRQRTPSGTIYNPSMEAFNNASLFNYEGPGGLDEYTYGQGLPMDYGIWGTPVGPNLYYEGQFGEGYREPNVADNAITLPPITMPEGIPQIPTQPNMPGFTSGGGSGGGTGAGGKDLNYFETLASMGIDPADAPSTTFPGINDKVVQEGIINEGSVLNETLPSGILDWVDGAADYGYEKWGELKSFGSDLVDSLFSDKNAESTGSGMEFIDMGNNYDYTGEDKALAESIMDGSAYAQLVYNNDPLAEALPGMSGKDTSTFNLGRPTDSNYEKFTPSVSKVPDIFRPAGYRESNALPFASPGGNPAVNIDGRNYTGSPYIGPNAKTFDLGGGAISGSLGANSTPDTKVYTTADKNTGQIVHVNEHTGSIIPTGQYMRGGRGL